MKPIIDRKRKLTHLGLHSVALAPTGAATQANTPAVGGRRTGQRPGGLGEVLLLPPYFAWPFYTSFIFVLILSWGAGDWRTRELILDRAFVNVEEVRMKMARQTRKILPKGN
jgi:hypothetical protein